MSVAVPTKSEMKRIAESYGFDLSDSEIELLTEVSRGTLASYSRLDLSDRYNGHYYAKAQNLSRALRGAYDHALESADVLLMPTTPMRAMTIPAPDDPLAYFGAALGNINNTCPFDVTGHPAISVPCGKVDGLPVGLILVGRHFDEGSVIRTAHAFESI